MKAIQDHLLLRNPRFLCKDPTGKHEFTVPLSCIAGGRATTAELKQLRKLAGREAGALEPLYTAFNGITFHHNGNSAGLVVVAIEDLRDHNEVWREEFSDLEPGDLYEFQRKGVAFATITSSGNYFVIHKGKVFYSSHDDGDDSPWGKNLGKFFERALSDPSHFYDDAGGYTRYSDGRTKRQFIPQSFAHD